MMFTKDQLWSSTGNPRTRSLFSETKKPGDEPIMTLNGGNKSLPCLRELYVPLVAEDPSEATFAETVFGDIRYWTKLREADFMESYLKEWNMIADIKRKQKAFEAIMDEVKSKGRSAFSAAKFLLDEPWKPNDKETKEAKRKSTEEAYNPFKEDVERLKDEGFIQ